MTPSFYRRQYLHRVPWWPVIDAGATSLLTFAVMLAAVNEGGPALVGEVALVNSVVLVAVGVSRQLISTPFLTAEREGSIPHSRLPWDLLSAPATLFLALGIALSLMPTTQIVGLGMLWIGVAVLQDAQRTILIGWNRYRSVAIIDTLALVLLLPVLLLQTTASGIVLSVCFGLMASTAFGLILNRNVRSDRFAGSVSQWHANLAHLARPLLVDSLVYLTTTQLFIWLLAVRATVAQVGQLRVATMLAFPLTILATGLSTPILQWLASAESNARWRRAIRLCIVLFITTVAVSAVVLLLLPAVNSWLLAEDENLSVLLVVLVLFNAGVVLSAMTFAWTAVLGGRTARIALWRAITGVSSLALLGWTELGTSATGAAAATLAGTVLLMAATVGLARRPSIR